MRVAVGVLVSVSRDHELHAELFRNRPELARVLLEVCRGIALPPGQASLATIDATQASPTERRADVVIAIRDGDATVAAVIVEVQNQIDTDKHLKWPLYVAALRARYGCPTTLLVLTSEPAVARWARTSIDTGHPGFQLTPIVLDYADLARIPEDKVSDPPELAVLYARANPTHDHFLLALEALARVGEADRRRVYSSFVTSGLPAILRLELENNMTPQLRSLWEHYSREDGRREGLRGDRDVIVRALVREGADDEMKARVELLEAEALHRIVSGLVERSASAIELVARESAGSPMVGEEP